MKITLTMIGLIITILGIIMIFDARFLTQKFFGFGDQNEGAAGFKIIGFVIAIIGGFIVFFNL